MDVVLSEFFASVLPALSADGCSFLCRSVKVCSFTEGEQVFVRGEPVAGLYFLLSGRIGIKKETGFEDKTQIIALLDPGALIGERSLLQRMVSDMVYSAGAVAVVSSRLILLPAAVYNELSQKFPDDGRLLLEKALSQTSRRLEKASERLAHIL